ncbi:unnamed protein product [Caenorhabditis brenneri]
MIWLHVIHYAGFLFAQITNSILVYLIITKAGKLFGSYRHVMCTFAMYSLIYAWIEVATQPVFHTKGQVFIVFVDSPLKYETWLVHDFASVYCGSFALCISLLGAQFFYRYVAMCKSELIHKLEGFKLLPIFIPCIICFLVYFLSVHIGMANTVEKQDFFREELLNVYGEDTRNISFIAQMYWSIGKNGEKIWKLSAIVSSIGCCSVIYACSCTIVYCAYNIYRSMKNAQCHMSPKTLELNRQLFITLTFQTILPFMLMYTPVGLFITLPLFEVPVGKLGNIGSACLAVYPSLEPIVAIVCIKEFRRTVMCYNRRKIQATYTQSMASSTIPIPA